MALKLQTQEKTMKDVLKQIKLQKKIGRQIKSYKIEKKITRQGLPYLLTIYLK